MTDVGKSEERELAQSRSQVRAKSGAAEEPADPACRNRSDAGSVVEDMTRVDEGRWGSREIEITGVTSQERER